MRISLALAGALIALVSFPTLAQKPSAPCTSTLTPLVLDLGEAVPLSHLYLNPTDESVTFTVTMHGNRLFGPGHVIGQVTLAPNTHRRGGLFHRTRLSTPVGTDTVVISVTTNRTGADVVG